MREEWIPLADGERAHVYLPAEQTDGRYLFHSIDGENVWLVLETLPQSPGAERDTLNILLHDQLRLCHKVTRHDRKTNVSRETSLEKEIQTLHELMKRTQPLTDLLVWQGDTHDLNWHINSVAGFGYEVTLQQIHPYHVPDTTLTVRSTSLADAVSTVLRKWTKLQEQRT